MYLAERSDISCPQVPFANSALHNINFVLL
jgi:hypothetical protein